MLQRSSEPLRFINVLGRNSIQELIKNRRLPLTVLGNLLLAACATNAHATEYTITTIPTGNIVPMGPSINNAGTIAFWGSQPDGTTGIYTYSGGVVHTVADSTGPLATFNSVTAINNNGVVAFQGSPLDGKTQGIYTASVGSSLTPIAVQSDTSNIGFNGGVGALNDAGTVAFSGYINGKPAVLSGNGGAVTVEAATGTSDGYKTFGGQVSINSSGVVAFTAQTNSGGIIATHGPGQIGTTIIANTTNPSTGYLSPSINDAGTVAYVDPYGLGGKEAILTHTVDGTFTYFATTYPSGPNIGFEMLNNNGQIVFEGSNYPQTGVIFDGPTTSDVAVDLNQLGMPTELDFGTDWFNDSGQVVLEYKLADGTYGIALATPAPEPLGLMAAAMGPLLLARRRRR